MKFLAAFISYMLFGMSTSGQTQAYYNVLDYGAKNDSTALATEAIVKAIDHASQAGGGTVFFPAGKYLTGPIHLKSNITLLIDAGAEISFSDNFDHYLPMVPSRWEGTMVYNFSPLIYAYEAENITIKGGGVLNGNGKKWWAYSEVQVKKSPESHWQKEFHRLNTEILHPDLPGWVELGFLRPPFIQTMYCKNVRIEDVTIKNSPFWTVNPEFSDNVTVNGITINNPPSPNTDGINPESCSNVHISNCHISVGDDCITIKSGKDRSGRKEARAAENYTITNCTMLSGHGGVVIGSEMSGDVRKITISNCVFDGTDRGIRIKTARGRGGVVEDIMVSNMVMKNIKQQAIVLDMQYAKTKSEPVSERTPIFRNIHLSGITAHGEQAGYLNGLEEMPIESITFDNIIMETKTGFLIKNAKNINFSNVLINAQKGAAIQASEVSALQVNGLRSSKEYKDAAAIMLNNVADAFITNSFIQSPIATFLQITGRNSTGIVLRNNVLNKVKKPVSKHGDVKEKIIVN
ncbi:glycoside hydrolase family 28 protein [Olivibacter sp. SDN3]|uniref:glycoside hydrolase family 28 protein n=1 Tax=Olivibacter sp. SDN3 TaxID=2764720 RepID=UPI00165131D4|nr:glycoside hydrolase family 28 protein [Olivibacter sp. SDN3]QNL52245.1 glycoside hydrolase family 28 protein [Olivibacter sp. SDN3]